jgi:hypothetical protein
MPSMVPRARPSVAPQRVRRAVAAAVALACSGTDDPKAMRNLGEECVSCHRAGAKAAEWPFTAGGTVYRTADEPASPGLGGVAIVLTDSAGKVVRLRSNAAGNFFTREALAFPVAVEVRRDGSERARSVRAGPCSAGACNGCHTQPPKGGAPGRLFAPL